MTAHAKAAARIQHGQNHGEAAGFPADHRAARRAIGRRRHQRLYFHQQGPRAFHPGEDRIARRGAVPVAEEQRGRIGDLRQAAARHLEHADLVGRAETVLHRAQDAEMMAALALEIENRIDEMLDLLGTGDLTILGDMADEQQRRAAGLGIAHQIERCRAHLRDGARRGIERAGPDRLDGVDGDDAWRGRGFQGGEDVLDGGRRA